MMNDDETRKMTENLGVPWRHNKKVNVAFWQAMRTSKCDYYEISAKIIRMLEKFSWSAKNCEACGILVKNGPKAHSQQGFDFEVLGHVLTFYKILRFQIPWKRRKQTLIWCFLFHLWRGLEMPARKFEVL